MQKIRYTEDLLFDGKVKHSRFQPFSHSFDYKLTYFWFDIVKNFKGWVFKRNRISFFSFYDNDHGPIESKIKDLCKYFKKQ